MITYQTTIEIECFKKGLEMIKGMKGDLIEIGVYEGGTAKIMAEMFPDKPIYLFDTYEGLPNTLNNKKGDPQCYYVGHCGASLETVKKNLKDCKNCEYFKGVFPETSEPMKDKKFCFAHIDVDIYKGTKDSLEFLYPRMLKGGLMIIHDYPILRGVKTAVDEFMQDKNNMTEQFGKETGMPRQLFIYF